MLCSVPAKPPMTGLDCADSGPMKFKATTIAYRDSRVVASLLTMKMPMLVIYYSLLQFLV